MGQAAGRAMLSATSYEGEFQAMKQKVAKFIIAPPVAHIPVINETLLFTCELAVDYEPF